VIQNIERVAAKLKAQPFTYLRGLPEGGVPLRQRRPVQAVARDIAVRSRLRHYERIGIEVLMRCAGDDFSSERRVPGRTHRIAGVAIVRWIEAQLRRERIAALVAEDAAEGPVVHEDAFRTTRDRIRNECKRQCDVVDTPTEGDVILTHRICRRPG